MREVFFGVALAAIAALVVPAFAQNDTDQLDKNGTQQYQPGTGGQSKAGKNGLPGNKSGESMNSDDNSGAAGAASGEQGVDDGSNSTGNAAGSDDAKVPGLPGNKSGPSNAPNGNATSK